MHTYSLSHLRQNIYDLFDGVEKRGDKLLIVRSGKVVGIVMPFAEGEEVEESLDPAFLREIRARAGDSHKHRVTMETFERGLSWKKKRTKKK